MKGLDTIWLILINILGIIFLWRITKDESVIGEPEKNIVEMILITTLPILLIKYTLSVKLEYEVIYQVFLTILLIAINF